MQTFKARRYQKGSAEPEEILIWIQEGQLCVTDSEHSQYFPASDFAVHIAGYDEGRIRLTSSVDSTVIMCEEPGFLEQFASVCEHPTVRAQIELSRQKLKNRKRGMLTQWLIFAFVLAVIGVSGYLSIDNIACLALDHIPPNVEEQLGAIRPEEVSQLDNHSDSEERVTKIGQRLVSHLKDNPYHFHFYVLNSKVVNAYARPGGTVIVFSQLLKQAHNDDEVAGIIGHEIGHVTHRDGLRYLAHSAGLWASIQIVLAGSAASTHLQEILTAAGLLQNLEKLRFSRAQESLADSVGVHLAFDSKYDPEAIIAFFQRIKKLDQFSDNKLFSLLTDHPMTEERITAIRDQVKTLKAHSHAPTLSSTRQ
jgi:beta-barrel assembly-enhancing protease